MIPKGERGVACRGGDSITVVSGGTGPRPPGITTWLRGARWTDPAQMPEKEARDRSPKSPRWSAERRASPRDARRLARRLACRVKARPTGARAPERYLGAPPPLIRVREAKKQKPGRKNAPRERRTMRCLPSEYGCE